MGLLPTSFWRIRTLRIGARLMAVKRLKQQKVAIHLTPGEWNETSFIDQSKHFIYGFLRNMKCSMNTVFREVFWDMWNQSGIRIIYQKKIDNIRPIWLNEIGFALDLFLNEIISFMGCVGDYLDGNRYICQFRELFIISMNNIWFYLLLTSIPRNSPHGKILNIIGIFFSNPVSRTTKKIRKRRKTHHMASLCGLQFCISRK